MARLKTVFEFQDQIEESLVGIVEPSVRKSEIERSRRKRPEKLDAYDLLLRAMPYLQARMPDRARIAIPSCRRHSVRTRLRRSARTSRVVPRMVLHVQRRSRLITLAPSRNRAYDHVAIKGRRTGRDTECMLVFVVSLLCCLHRRHYQLPRSHRPAIPPTALCFLSSTLPAA